MIMNTIHTLSLTFDMPLRHHELPRFRGAMAQIAGWEQDLFHNHDNSAAPGAYMHRYPLVQYRVHQGQAGVFGINGGARALEELLESRRTEGFFLNGQPRPLECARIQRNPRFEPEVVAADLPFSYRIYRYLPFGDRRIQDYHRAADMHAKIDLLARLLRNHIVAFAHGVGWDLPEERKVEVGIADFGAARKLQVKEQPVMAFDLEFRSNARLPEGLGLGRKTAFGFGTTVPLP